MRIHPEIMKCVAFAGYRENGQTILGGTVFFINLQVAGRQERSAYAVTAKHVVDGCKARDDNGMLWIRMNRADGGTHEMQTACIDWTTHPSDDSVDLALFELTDDRELEDDHIGISLETFRDRDLPNRCQLGPGDEVFFTGLFKSHPGTERILPVLRRGTIAAMPEERIQTKAFGKVEAYLVEVRSFKGLSGSPVFALYDNPMPRHMMSGVEFRDGNWVRPEHECFLLGLLSGHFESDANTLDAADDVGLKVINVGIAMVVPTSKILEILDHAVMAQDSGDVPDSATSE